MLVAVLMAPLLLMLQLVMPVTSRLMSAKVTSYRRPRTTKDGPVRWALDTANKTMSSSSLEDCSLSCARDDACTGFNIKNLTTCDMYNYNPKITALVSDYTFYQVDNISN